MWAFRPNAHEGLSYKNGRLSTYKERISMECYNCGLKLPADAERCPRCGQRFKPREQSPANAEKPSLSDRIKGLFGKSQ